MEKIIDKINVILTTLTTSTNIRKDSLYEDVNTLDKLLANYVKDIQVDTSKFDDLLRGGNIEQIKLLDEKLSKMSSNKTIVLTNIVEAGEEKIRSFLKKYNIGFLKDIYLNNSGKFVVNIPCLISKHNSFHDRDYSGKIEFEHQLEVLKSLGIDLGESKISPKSPAILATQSSIDALTTLISNIGGIGQNYNVRVFKNQATIREISFKISPEKLLAYDEVPFEMSCEISDVLNPDEVLLLIHELKELKSTCVSYIDDDLIKAKENCRNIILHTFSNICKTLNIETTISKATKDHYSDVRKENEVIIAKKKEINSKLDASNISKITEDIESKVTKFASEQIGFVYMDFEIRSVLCITLKFNRLGDDYSIFEETTPITEEEIKKKFECSDGMFEDESLFILNTKENIDKLRSVTNDYFKDAEITNIQTEYKDYIGYYIDKITLSFKNLNVFE